MLDESDSVHKAPQNAERQVGIVRVKGRCPIRAGCPYTIAGDEDVDCFRADLDSHHQVLTRAHEEPSAQSCACLAHRHLEICCRTRRETGDVGYAQGRLPGHPFEVASPRKLHLDGVPGVSSRCTSPLGRGITATRLQSAGIPAPHGVSAGNWHWMGGSGRRPPARFTHALGTDHLLSIYPSPRRANRGRLQVHRTGTLQACPAYEKGTPARSASWMM